MRCNFLKKYALFLFLAFLFLAFFPTNVLEVKFNEETICYSPLTSNLTLIVDYIHSVSLTKVVDVYCINKSGIFAVQERWQQFDAGQPLEANVEDGFYVKNMNMYLGESWEYWFIPLNNVTIMLNGKIIFSKPREEGIMRFELLKVPAIIAIIRWC